jgi:AcrR family transcriptional regulator
MSRGNQLQEMEAGTKQSKTAVNANAKSAEPMQHLSGNIPPGQTASWEDLGGPTPENYKSDDDSAKLKTPGGTLKQVKDVVNKGAKPAEAMKGMKEEEELEDEEVILESDDDEEVEEVLAEEGEEDEDEDEEEEIVEEELNIEEDVNALLEGEELSEEFQEKAKTIFEAAIKSRVSQIQETLENHYAIALEEEVQEIKDALSERVDSYLEYVADEWFNENSLVIEKGLKEELTESFMTGLKGLFEEHYVSIPEDKYDVLESMVEKLDEMETKLNEQIEKNVSLNKRLAESVAEGIFEQVSEGLALTQKDKLASLAESVEFESEEEYREKLETLKEAYFPSKTNAPRAKTESLSEQVDSSPENISGSMSAYLNTLSRFRK